MKLKYILVLPMPDDLDLEARVHNIYNIIFHG